MSICSIFTQDSRSSVVGSLNLSQPILRGLRKVVQQRNEELKNPVQNLIASWKSSTSLVFSFHYARFSLYYTKYLSIPQKKNSNFWQQYQPLEIQTTEILRKKKEQKIQNLLSGMKYKVIEIYKSKLQVVHCFVLNCSYWWPCTMGIAMTMYSLPELQNSKVFS